MKTAEMTERRLIIEGKAIQRKRKGTSEREKASPELSLRLHSPPIFHLWNFLTSSRRLASCSFLRRNEERQ